MGNFTVLSLFLSALLSLPGEILLAQNAPVISFSGPALTVQEDNSLAILPSNLTIVDADGDTDFTVIVEPGIDYTESGDSFTPSLNYNGNLTVNVKVNDGSFDSNSIQVDVVVTPENDAPTIAFSGPALTVSEDNSLAIQPTDLTIADVDGDTDFTVIIEPGINYTESGDSFTPSLNYNGNLTVNVKVNDGSFDSNSIQVDVVVTPENDAPTIAFSGPALTVSEDNSLIIQPTDLTIADVDGDTDFTVIVEPGIDYTESGDSFTPSLNYNGTLTVNVKVNDGTFDSNSVGVEVEVTPVNDLPSITAQEDIEILEDGSYTILVTDVTILDPDNTAGFTLTAANGANYTRVGNVITPAPNYWGDLSVPVTVSDGTDSSTPPFNFTITVEEVNDPPSIASQSSVSIPENGSYTILVTDVTIVDIDNASGFTLTAGNGANYTRAGNTITPTPGYSGTVTVPVTVSDGTDSSTPPFNFTITVDANVPPTITGQDAINIFEDGSYTILVTDVDITDPDNASGFTLTAGNGANYTRVGNAITPTANYFGTLTVPVTVSDGTASSAPPFNFIITVDPVNDAPSIASQSSVSIPENGSYTILVTDVTIVDIDNASGFTLTAGNGANYTRAGNTITPTPGYSGTVTVPVTVSDGTDSSTPPFNFTITVDANVPPTITGQDAINIFEDGSYTILVTDVDITDPDNASGFTLAAGNGANYTRVGNAITPTANYFGTLTVPVTVSDGTASSAPPFNFIITVDPVNDAPSIASQSSVSIPENGSYTILVTDVTIVDIDNASGFTLTAGNGANYTRAGNTITPTPGYSGTVTVPVTVSDGTDSSTPPFNFTITVDANVPPTITGQDAINILEDGSYTILVTDVTILDPDNASGFTLAAGNGANYTRVGNAITPTANYFGTLTVPVTVSDGTASSAPPFNFIITVDPVNDPPSIASQSSVSIPENGNYTILVTDVTIVDIDNASGFTLTAGNGANYTRAGNTITPTPGYSGTVTVPVTVSDGTDSSTPPFNFTITVDANVPPTITGQDAINIFEDGSYTILVTDVDITDPDNASGFTLAAGNGANYTRVGNAITPTANYFGTLTVPVTVSDGTASSAPPFNFIITVDPVNDAPTIGGVSDVSVPEGSPTQIIAFGGISTGAANEIGQTLTVNVSNDNNSLFSSVVVNYTSGNAGGTLSITPNLGAVGDADFTLTVSDNGGSTPPNANSAFTTFNFELTAVANNDPSFGNISGVIVNEDVGLQNVTITTVTSGDAGQTASFTAVSDNITIIPHPNIIYDGTATEAQLSFTPQPDRSGIVTITVTLTDAEGGVYSQGFSITVNEINDEPTLNDITGVSVSENAATQTVNLGGISSGSPFESQILTVVASHNNSALLEDIVVNYTSPAPTGSLSITPKANMSGPATVDVILTDNGATGGSNDNIITKSFVFMVNAVNELPFFDLISNLSVDEDSGPRDITITGVTSGDPGQTAAFSALSSNTLIIPHPSIAYGGSETTATLTFTPQLDRAGLVTATVTLNDGEAVYSQPFNITVNEINDQPTIAAINDVVVSENAGEQIVSFNGIGTGSPFETQGILVAAAHNNNALLEAIIVNYGSPNPGGTLSITPKPNVSGSATVDVVVTDDGPTGGANVNSITESFSFIVNDVVNPPLFDLIGDVIVNEDVASQNINITGVTSGDIGETATITAVSSDTNVIPDPTITYDGTSATATLTYQPQPNRFGPVVITVTIEDQEGLTYDQTFTITVTDVNDLPTFAVINDVSVAEDAASQNVNITGISPGPFESGTVTVTATSSNTVIIPDPSVIYDGTSGSGTLSFQPGANRSGGPVTITVRAVDDGGAEFTRTFNITVDEVNDAPTLSAIGNVSVPESAPMQVINLAGIGTGSPFETQVLTVTASHDNPALLGPVVVNYTSPGATGTLNITPLTNVSGTATVTVIVTDNGSGTAPSVNTFQQTFIFAVDDVNNPPTFDPIANVTVAEDAASQNVNITGISPGPSESGTVTITATSSNTVIIPDPGVTYDGTSGSGTLSFQPAANQSGGPVTITVRAVDDGGAEFTRTFDITVDEVNDAPTLSAIGDVSVAESAPMQVINLAGIGTGSPFETQVLTVTASHDNPALLGPVVVNYTSPGATGTLNITPLTNVSGTATVTVIVTDNGSSTAPSVNTFQQTFIFAVDDVNNPPTFDPIANVTVAEDAASQNVNITGISPGPSESGTVTITATSSNTVIIPDPGVTYDGTSGSGTLSFQPAANQSGGPVTITVRAVDDGGVEFTRTFNITVDEVNDAPTLNAIGNVSVAENPPMQVINLAGIGTGSPFETQFLTVSVSHDNPTLLNPIAVVYNSADPTGTLNIIAMANTSGSANVTVTVTDNGSSVAPSINTFQRTFIFSVNDVNDPPTFDPIANVTVMEDAASQIVNITGISPGPSESGAVTVTATSDNAAVVPDPIVTYDGTSGSGTLSFQPVANQSGTATITVRAVDSGSAEFTRTFVITVDEVNDAPTLNAIGNVSVAESAPMQVINLAGITSGSPFETQVLTVTASHDNPALLGPIVVNYTSPGATGTLNITPVASVSGSATVTVTVTDNGSSAAPSINTFQRTFIFSVNDVNDPPTFDPIANVAVTEDVAAQIVNITGISPGPAESGSVTLTATSSNTAIVPDPSVAYDGTSGSGTLSFQPAANQSGGPVTITVRAVDDGAAEFTRTFDITVTEVNDAPTLTAIGNVSVGENAPMQVINLAGIGTGSPFETQVLTVTASHDNPALLGPIVVNYTSPGGTGTLNITPVASVSGSATVTVTVTDNGSSAAPSINTFQRTFIFAVNDVNDPPTFDPIANVAVTEDVAAQIVNITGISPGPAESGSVTVTATSSNTAIVPDPSVVYDGTSGSGTLSFQPAANQSGGPVTITVRAVDDGAAEFTRTFDITVTEVNDAPTLTAIGNVSVGENAPMQVINLAGIGTGSPFETQVLTVTASHDNAGLLGPIVVNYTSPGATGTLNITPLANASGNTTVTVTITDNGSATAPSVNTFQQTFTFAVNSVNDPPVFDPIANVVVEEDAGPQTVNIDGISPGAGETETLTLTATSSNPVIVPNPTITYDGTSASAVLNFQSAANRNGTVTITVLATDPGGLQFSRTFTITVQPVNDAPTLDVIADMTVPEEGPLQTITLTGIGDGEPIEIQTLSVAVSTDMPALFEVIAVNYTSPQVTGALNIQPKANASGSASVTITVTDGGPGAAPNVNTFSRTFTYTITAINDAPVITAQTPSPVVINEDQNFTIQLSNLIIVDPDNASGFVLAVAAGSNYTFAGATITPTADYFGTLTVPITVSDGTTISTPFNFIITVSPVNDAPNIIAQNPVSVAEAQPIPLDLGMLVVQDPDPEDIYPDDFILNILAGANYSVTGTTVTPIANFSGVLSVGVFVNDGQANSNTYTLQIQVASVNDPPVITGQNATVTTNEEESTTLAVTMLNISDPDNVPGDFTLTILPNTNYTVSGLTVTPRVDLFGPLSVNVTVSDGLVNSAPFAMQITVNPVNDPPVISGQNGLFTPENTPLTLKLADLLVTDVDNTYPTGFTLTPSPGSNYTVAGLVVTPALNFNGTLSIPVVVNDGAANSNTFNLQVQVSEVNNPPVITGQNPAPMLTTEDIPVTIALTNLIVTDVDTPGYPNGFSISIQPGTNYTFSGTTVTPALDYVGPLSVNVRVSDGTSQSETFAFQISVEDQNDPPVITGQNPVSVAEDQSVGIQISQLIINDPDNDTFTLVVLPGTNYTVSGSTVTPIPNFFGNLTVGVTVSDGPNTSAPYNMLVAVTPVNDAPSFDPIANIILAENAGTYTITITNISPGPLESQPLLVSATSSNATVVPDPTFLPVYNGTATTATIQVKPNANQTGDVTITVKVTDPGFLEFTQTFVVSVSDINDPPTLDPITYGPILEDAELQSIGLTGITAGPLETQVLTVTPSTNKPELFEQLFISYTSPGTTGTLNIKPAANAFGVATITVRVTDNGSNTPPHVNFFERTFDLTITPVNDAPVFTSTPLEIAAINELYEYSITVTDTDPSDVITITAIEIPAWLTLTAQGTGMALLSGSAPANAVGAVTIKLQAKDNGNAMTSQDYTLRINTRPMVTDFSLTLEEDEVKVIGVLPFSGAFTDADGDALQKIKIIKLPVNGQLLLNNQVVSLDQEIDISATNNLAYQPQQDFFGKDTVEWKGGDALNFSANAAKIFISVSPINDPPVIVNLEQTVLEFSVGEGPGIISTAFEVMDVDNETLTGAEIRFRQNFVPEVDILYFTNTSKITGVYDPETGILTLTGVATVAEYNEAIRSITYDNISEVFSDAEVTKTISYTVDDGIVLSETRDRQIKLIDLFEDITIPNGFTPNNDPANDTWVIVNIERYTDAVVKVFNIRGQEVYSSEGVYAEWDGMSRGEPLPSDTYYYTIDLRLPFRKKVYKGAVTILR